MNKAERLLLILNLMRARRNLRAEDLASECGVSQRTIYRDIKAISDANIPIYFENGYKYLTDAFLPPLNFTLEEYLALYLGLNSEVIESDPILKDSRKRIIIKLESLMPENVRNDYLEIKEKIDSELQLQNQDSSPSPILDLWRIALSRNNRKE
jgi:predicted DNA-binding transcriptional regulator YafY